VGPLGPRGRLHPKPASHPFLQGQARPSARKRKVLLSSVRSSLARRSRTRT
jgi:hypothetical protein